MSNHIQIKKSAGTFLLRKIPDVNTWEVCMIYKNHDTRSGWVLPKGGIEEGETNEQAAIRETQEETGVQNVILIKHLKDYKYQFTKNEITTEKTVIWYLAFTNYIENQQLLIGTTESEKKTQKDTKWFGLSEAIILLREEEDRIILDEIIKLLK